MFDTYCNFTSIWCTLVLLCTFSCPAVDKLSRVQLDKIQNVSLYLSVETARSFISSCKQK
nr:MAG TPA: hypothetical protein [Caudoviricetes sp.]